MGADMGDEIERVSMEEIEAEDATSLPNKEVMSLLDVNANVDLGLDLAAPVDLAAAANLNVAAPIEAAASANLLSDNAEAVAISQQHGTIDQGISGTADATANQQAEIAQNSDPTDAPATGAVGDGGAAAPLAAGTDGALDGATGAVGDTAGTVGDTAGTVGDTVGGVTDGATGAVGDTAGTVGDATDGVTGGVDSLLSGGSLLDANVDIDANANLTAPVDGAVAANANVAAPINASVAANIGSDHAVAQAAAVQDVDIQQHLDDVSAEATAQQNADIQQ